MAATILTFARRAAMSGGKLRAIRLAIACVDFVLLCGLKCRSLLGLAAARQKRALGRLDMVDPEQEVAVQRRIQAISERLRLDSGFALCIWDELTAQTLMEQKDRRP